MEYNEKLKELRVQNNMSQEQLAERLHVTRQTISKWEQGINQPDIYTLKQYAEIFNITLDELIGDGVTVKSPSEKRRAISKILFVVNTLFLLFCVMTVFILWRFVEGTIPGHYNITGEIDRYANKAEILLHLLSFALFYLIALCTYIVGKRKVGTKLPNITTSSFIALFSVVLAIQIGYLVFVLCLYAPYLVLDNLLSFIYCEVGALVLPIAIATHPKVTPQNAFIGMRTTFTLTNPIAWDKVNTFSAFCMSATAILMITLNMIFLLSWVALGSTALLFVAVVIMLIYHQILKSKLNNAK